MDDRKRRHPLGAQAPIDAAAQIQCSTFLFRLALYLVDGV